MFMGALVQGVSLVVAEAASVSVQIAPLICQSFSTRICILPLKAVSLHWQGKHTDVSLFSFSGILSFHHNQK